MTLAITFSSAKIPDKGTVAVVISGSQPGAAGEALDKATDGALSRAMKVRSFAGKAGESLVLTAVGGYDHVLLVSAGKEEKIDDKALRTAGGHVYSALVATKAKSATLFVDVAEVSTTAPAKQKGKSGARASKKNATVVEDSTSGTFSAEEGEHLALVAQGALLRSYRFDKYHTDLKADDLPQLGKLTVAGEKALKAKKAFVPLEAVAQGVFFTRDLVSEPANILYPESFAKQCAELKKLGLKVKVLGPAEMKKLGMGSLLGVAQGSVREARLVALEWWGKGAGEGPSKAPVVFCGKGVTFDTGGISIKPAAGMDEMKFDMGGAGAVVGAMKALALRKAKANVVGIVGLVENMPDGNAIRPGDVLTSMSGKTIEVLNTDAEGRLVLADVVTYAQQTYKPRAIVDLATLTGACIVTFGHIHAAVMSNSQELADSLMAAGESSGERLWQLPVGEEYSDMIKSPIADVNNTGPARKAGTIMGAVFIQAFIEDDMPWAHLDIASTVWAYKDTPLCPKGGSGFGVHLLDRFIAESYEK